MSCRFLIVLAAVVLATPHLTKADIMSVGSAAVPLGATLTVPVTISGASDLYAYEFDVSFDPSILQLQSVLEGPFLQSAGATFFVPGMIDNLAGTATFNADTLLALIPGAIGSGDLVTLSFHATGIGISAITLSNVVLLDSELNDISFMAHAGSVAVATVPEASSAWLLVLDLLCCSFVVGGRRVRSCLFWSCCGRSWRPFADRSIDPLDPRNVGNDPS